MVFIGGGVGSVLRIGLGLLAVWSAIALQH